MISVELDRQQYSKTLAVITIIMKYHCLQIFCFQLDYRIPKKDCFCCKIRKQLDASKVVFLMPTKIYLVIQKGFKRLNNRQVPKFPKLQTAVAPLLLWAFAESWYMGG